MDAKGKLSFSRCEVKWDGPGLALGMAGNHSLIPHFVDALVNEGADMGASIDTALGTHIHTQQHTSLLHSLSKYPLKSKVSFSNRHLWISKETL